MIGFGSIAKWLAILAIVGIVATGIKKGYDYHINEIQEAVNTAKLEFAVTRQEAVNRAQDIMKEQSALEKERIDAVLKIERNKVKDLERQLLIDHDLDRLLQRKPVLVLNIVNKGTEEVLKELEDATQ